VSDSTDFRHFFIGWNCKIYSYLFRTVVAKCPTFLTTFSSIRCCGGQSLTSISGYPTFSSTRHPQTLTASLHVAVHNTSVRHVSRPSKISAYLKFLIIRRFRMSDIFEFRRSHLSVRDGCSAFDVSDAWGVSIPNWQISCSLILKINRQPKYSAIMSSWNRTGSEFLVKCGHIFIFSRVWEFPSEFCHS